MIFGRIGMVCNTNMKQKFQSPRPFYKGSYTSFAKAIKIRFDLL